MTSRYIMPRQGTKGQNLTPTDGSKLFFFEVGTSADKDTFSDEAGTITNTNPIVSDSRGLFGSIFITGDYDVTFRDKNDKLYWGPEKISEILSATDSSVAIQELTTATMAANTSKIYEVGDIVQTAEFSTGNGGSGTYDVVLTSSVTPNTFNIIIGVADALISFVLRIDKLVIVTQFGAAGDGVTVNTGAIQAAIDFAKTIVLDEGPVEPYKHAITSTVYFPSGHYLSGQIKLFQGIILNGESLPSVILQHNGTGLTDFIVVDETKIQYKTSVTNMWVKGNGKTNTRYGLKLHQLFYQNFIDHLMITDCEHGMFLTECFTLTLNGCHIRDNTHGVTWDNSNAATITNNRIEYNINYNLKIINAGSVYIRSVFQGAETDDSVILTECNGAKISICNFEDNNRNNTGKADLNVQGSVVTINGGFWAQTVTGKGGIKRNNGVAITANVGILSVDGVMMTPGAFYKTGLKLTFSGAWGDTVIDACQLNDPDTVVESGTHDGSNGAAVLSDSTQSFVTNEFTDRKINNTTDGSTATIDSNTGTTVTGPLSGGTDVWNNGDAYTITGGVQLDIDNYAGSVNPSGLGGTQVAHRQSFLGPVDRNHGIIIGDKTYSTAIQHTDSRGTYPDGVMVIIDPAVKTNLTNTEHTILIDARTLITANISGIIKGATTTFLMTTAHGFKTDWTIEIDNIVDNGPAGDIESTFNGNSYVITVTGTHTFTVAVNSSGLTNEWASAGTALRAAAQTVKVQGTFDKPFFFGVNAVWVDATGDFRINVGQSATDLGGTIVGTQS